MQGLGGTRQGLEFGGTRCGLGWKRKVVSQSGQDKTDSRLML